MTRLIASTLSTRLSFAFGALLLAACQSKPDTSEHAAAAARNAVVETDVPPSQRAQFAAPTGGVAFQDTTLASLEPLAIENYLLIPDPLNHAVRRVDIATGFTSTVAGTLGGGGSPALVRPTAVDIGGQGDAFVADTGNHTILHFIQRSQALHNLVGSPGQAGYSTTGVGKFNAPEGVCVGDIVSSNVSTIFVADTGNSVIRKVVLNQSGMVLAASSVTLVAGIPGQAGFVDNQPGAQAKLNRPTGITYQPSSKKLYVADTGNHVIRVVDLSTAANTVTTLAGVPGSYGYRDGDLGQALFAQPVSISIVGLNSSLLVADRASYTVRNVDILPGLPSPQVTTVAGSAWQKGFVDGDPTQSRFRAPGGVTNLNGVSYVIDTGNNLVRAITPQAASSSISTLTGLRTRGAADGGPEAFTIGSPSAIACHGNQLFINGAGLQVVDLDLGANAGQARLLTSENWTEISYVAGVLYRPFTYTAEALVLQTGARSFFASTQDGQNGSTGPFAACGSVLAGSDTGYASRFSPTQGLDNFSFSWPGGPNACADGRTEVYTQLGAGLLHYDVSLTSPTASVLSVVPALAGYEVQSLAITGGFAYYTRNSDPGRLNDIRRINLSTGAVSTFVGQPAPGGAFNAPSGLCASGNNLFVADTGNSAVRRVDLTTGEIATVAIRRAQ